MKTSFRSAGTRVGILGTKREGYGAWINEGILQYADQKPDWQLFHEAQGNPEGFERLTRVNKVDALLCEPGDAALYPLLRRWRKPRVLLARKPPLAAADNLHRVRLDNSGVGRLAFQTFQELGFRSFVYLGHPDLPLSSLREQGYTGAARAAGFSPLSLKPRSTEEGVLVSMLREALQRLTPPLALFGMNDYLCLRAIRAALGAGISVPEDLAVLGVDNDPQICRLCHPSLSSIDPNTTGIGYHGAALLDALLQGKTPETQSLLLLPRGVVHRGSTNTLPAENPNLRRVFAYLRDNACEDIRLEDVVRLAHMSRRSLETAYKRTFGRTLWEQITHHRVQRAKELLRQTDLPTPDIAAACAWPSASHMSVVFKRHTGMAPTAYRKQERH